MRSLSRAPPAVLEHFYDSSSGMRSTASSLSRLHVERVGRRQAAGSPHPQIRFIVPLTATQQPPPILNSFLCVFCLNLVGTDDLRLPFFPFSLAI